MAKKKTSKKKTPSKSRSAAGKSEVGEHGVKSITAALKGIHDAWNDAEEVSFAEVPDGKYQIQIDKATNINHAKSSARLQCSWHLNIVAGPQRGRKLFKHDGLEDETSLGYFRGGLAHLGVEWPASPTQLPDTVADLVGSFAQVTVRTKGEYQNVYFDKALDSDEIEDAEVGESEEIEEVEAEEPEVEESEEVEEHEWKVGDRAIATIEGSPYPGEVNGVNKKKSSLSISFDDGDEMTVSMDVVEFAEAEEAEEPEVEESEEVEPEVEEEAAVDCKFKEAAIKGPQKLAIQKLAKKNGFDPEDYDNQVDLLSDLGEYAGVSGVFKDPASLLTAIEKA